MALVVPIHDSVGRTLGYKMRCPGCRHIHHFHTARDNQPWVFNGDYDKPTFGPDSSIFWIDEVPSYCCHFFLRDGVFEFCGDCSHEARGKNLAAVDI